MRFGWNRGNAAEIEPNDDEAASPPYDLAAIELLTDEGCLVGWIATEGERTSDWLNHHAELPILGLGARDDAAPPQPLHPGVGQTSLPRERVIWVVPPPLPPNRHLRLHRRRTLVHLELDEWEVSGQLHVRPGADATDQMLRGTREMVPLTEVQVASRDNPGQGTSLPVIIVNRSHVRRVIVDQPHMAAASPDPVGDGLVAVRLAALGVAAEEVVTDDASGQRTDPGPEASPEGGAEPTALDSAGELVQAALKLLRDVGVIDAAEFRAMSARPVRPAD